MHRSKVAGLAALLCSVASVTLGVARANPLEGMGPVQIGVHGGTLGLGVNAGLDISEKFAARGMFNTFGLDYEETESGNEYKGDLDLQSIGLVTDWHPFAGGFRVTGGLFLNNNEVSATATERDLDIGGTMYDGEISMLLDFESIAPYFGAGWTSGPIGEPGFSFSVDAGLLYQSTPRISGSGRLMGTGPQSSCSFSLSTGGHATLTGCSGADFAALEDDLESEHAELSGELEDFEWYPVLSIGVSYRF